MHSKADVRHDELFNLSHASGSSWRGMQPFIYFRIINYAHSFVKALEIMNHNDWMTHFLDNAPITLYEYDSCHYIKQNPLVDIGESLCEINLHFHL